MSRHTHRKHRVAAAAALVMTTAALAALVGEPDLRGRAEPASPDAGAGGGAGYDLRWTIDAGGGVQLHDASLRFELSGAAGQPDSSVVAAADPNGRVFELAGGFWADPDVEPRRVLYVRAGGTGARDGADWANAYAHLADAISRANALNARALALNDDFYRVDEIWVGPGEYRPDQSAANPSGSNDPNATFLLPANVAVYGGFAGTERALAERRIDVSAIKSVLSGEIGAAGAISDNSLHVVTASAVGAMKLDGFEVRGGNARGAGPLATRGGGLIHQSGSLIVANCTLFRNQAFDGGGAALRSGGGAADLVNVLFVGNTAVASTGSGGGGGLFVENGASVQVVNAVFSGNRAAGASSQGAAIRAVASTVALINSTISNNTVSDPATGAAAGLSFSAGSIVSAANTLLWFNTSGGLQNEAAQISSAAASVTYCGVQGLSGYAGAGNSPHQPEFDDPDGADGILGTPDDRYALRYGSAGVDMGSNALVPPDDADLDADGDLNEPTPVDLLFQPRLSDGAPGRVDVVDMGAVETQQSDDCNNNGIPDACDISCGAPGCEGVVGCGASPDCNEDGIPDECPLIGDVDVEWAFPGDGFWSVASDWCPPVVPNNQPLTRYYVLIGPAGGAAPVVSLNGESPTVQRLELEPNSALELSEGSSRTLSFADPNVVSLNRGEIRVRSTGAQATLTLQDINLSQVGGKLLATGQGVGKAVLRLTECQVSGGALEARSGGEIRMFGSTVSITSASSLLVGSNSVYAPEDLLSPDHSLEVGEVYIESPLTDPNTVGGQMRLAGTMTADVAGETRIAGPALRAQCNGCTPPVLKATASASFNTQTLHATLGGAVLLNGQSALGAAGLVRLDVGGVLKADPNEPGARASVFEVGAVIIGAGGDDDGALLELSGVMQGFVLGDLTLLGGQCPPLTRGCTPPVLRITDNAVLHLGGDLIVNGSALVQIETPLAARGGEGAFEGASIAGDVRIAAVDPAAIDWDNGAVRLVAGAPGPRTFEVAGVDVGADEEGLVGNYAIGRLEVAAGALVRFVDAIDNQGNGPQSCSEPLTEALYVDTLVLGAGADVQVDACRVYYRTLIDHGANISFPSGCGGIEGLGTRCAGDLNCDDLVNFADIDPFVLALQGQAAYAAQFPNCAWLSGDVNSDGTVNFSDIDPFVARIGVVCR